MPRLNDSFAISNEKIIISQDHRRMTVRSSQDAETHEGDRMAKVKLNPMIEEVQGKFGDMVFRRTRNGGLSLIRKADMSKVKWSPAQKANRQRFREATAYAKQALTNPELRAMYEEFAAQTGKRPNEVAISDYLKKQKK